MRKSYTADFKAKVALQAIKGDRSVSELAAKFEVKPTQIRLWKKTMLEEMPGIFSDKRKKKAVSDEGEKAKLYEQIGRLKVENDWLKKKSDEFFG
jgi:transposase-like protein